MEYIEEDRIFGYYGYDRYGPGRPYNSYDERVDYQRSRMIDIQEQQLRQAQQVEERIQKEHMVAAEKAKMLNLLRNYKVALKHGNQKVADNYKSKIDAMLDYHTYAGNNIDARMKNRSALMKKGGRSGAITGGLISGGIGAISGAGIHGGKGALIGAGIGGLVGAGVGYLAGRSSADPRNDYESGIKEAGKWNRYKEDAEGELEYDKM
jgi:hypothetical protein